MKTLNDVAKVVFDMENEIDNYNTIQSVSVGFETYDKLSLEYGITIRDILDCVILVVGLWGSGVVHTINWDECRGCDDKSGKVLWNFYQSVLNKTESLLAVRYIRLKQLTIDDWRITL